MLDVYRHRKYIQKIMLLFAANRKNHSQQIIHSFFLFRKCSVNSVCSNAFFIVEIFVWKWSPCWREIQLNFFFAIGRTWLVFYAITPLYLQLHREYSLKIICPKLRRQLQHIKIVNQIRSRSVEWKFSHFILYFLRLTDREKSGTEHKLERSKIGTIKTKCSRLRYTNINCTVCTRIYVRRTEWHPYIRKIVIHL